MARTCTPTDQAASCNVNRIGAIDGAGFDLDTDQCLPTACAGNQNGVRLYVTGELTLALVGAAASGDCRLEYSTNGGGAWSILAQRTATGTTPSTEYSVVIGSVDLAQVRVRAYAFGYLSAASGSYNNSAEITAWRLVYSAGGQVIILG